jgi:hypothetical protein
VQQTEAGKDNRDATKNVVRNRQELEVLAVDDLLLIDKWWFAHRSYYKARRLPGGMLAVMPAMGRRCWGECQTAILASGLGRSLGLTSRCERAGRSVDSTVKTTGRKAWVCDRRPQLDPDHANVESLLGSLWSGRRSTVCQGVSRRLEADSNVGASENWRTDDVQCVRLRAGIVDPRGVCTVRREANRGAESYSIPPEAFIPRIELISGWLGAGVPDDIVDESEHRGELAAVFARGHVIRFHAPTFTKMPGSIAADVIAHELAHVYQWATGYETISGTADPGDGDIEMETDERAEG